MRVASLHWPTSTTFDMTVGNIEYSEARKFNIVDKNLPTVRAHDILVGLKYSIDDTQCLTRFQIKVKACGVCGTDLHIHEGEFGAQVGTHLPLNKSSN